MRFKSGLYEGQSIARSWFSGSQSFTISALWTGQLSCCKITSSVITSPRTWWKMRTCSSYFILSGHLINIFWPSLRKIPKPLSIACLCFPKLHKTDQISCRFVSTQSLYHQKTTETSLHLWTRFVSSLWQSKSCVGCIIQSGWAQFWLEWHCKNYCKAAKAAKTTASSFCSWSASDAVLV